MQTHKLLLARLIVATLLITATGCAENENKQLAEMAERHLDRQAEQNQQMAKLQEELVAGSRQLVEADAKAREEIVALHRDVQAERTEIGQQRDALENDRRQIAEQRHRDPIIANAITGFGLLLACLLPLVLCWYLLHRPVEAADSQVVAEVLLEDLVSGNPLLIPRAENVRAIGQPGNGESHRPSIDSNRANDSD
jgi:TolA-binding protein